MRKILIILFLLFQFGTIAAECTSDQIIDLTPENDKTGRNEVPIPEAWFKPNDNKLEISNVIDKNLTIQVADESGSILYRGSLDSSTNTVRLPTLTEGLYSVKLESPDNQYEGVIDVF